MAGDDVSEGELNEGRMKGTKVQTLGAVERARVQDYALASWWRALCVKLAHAPHVDTPRSLAHGL